MDINKAFRVFCRQFPDAHFTNIGWEHLTKVPKWATGEKTIYIASKYATLQIHQYTEQMWIEMFAEPRRSLDQANKYPPYSVGLSKENYNIEALKYRLKKFKNFYCYDYQMTILLHFRFQNTTNQ